MLIPVRFRWVQCQLDALSKLRTPGAVREALTKLPPTLDKTYEGLLQRINVEEDKNLAREILEILAFTLRPLKLHEVHEILQITPGLQALDESKSLADPLDILSICGSLLSYQKETEIVTLAHHSVKAYLTSDLQGKNEYFLLRPSNAHRNLAIKCLTYMDFNDFSSGPCPSANALRDRYEHFPLLEYAAQRWALHVRSVEELDESIWKVMKSFLFSADEGRGNFYAWVQLLLPTSDIRLISKTPPLYYAASFGLTEVVKYLLDAGADMEVHAGRGGATPLNIASFRGHYDVAKLLLERGADPHAIDRYASWSAIEWARYNGHGKVFRLLTGSEDGTDDLPPFDREHVRTTLISRRQQMGDLGAQSVIVTQTDIAPPWGASTASRSLWWTLVTLAESKSEHPSGRAIIECAHPSRRLHKSPIMKGNVVHFEAIVGRGVSAYVEPENPKPSRTYHVLIGSKILLGAKGIKLPASTDIDNDRFREDFPGIIAKQFSLIFVAIDNEYAGLLVLTDSQHALSRPEKEKELKSGVLPFEYEKLTEPQKLRYTADRGPFGC